ncbi:hypothetical protein [Methylorubrum extorquens]|uniref:Transcriptional coactivator p15 (PC4) C-terminal domain-containing protein n=1 Tax=Methylorubrum extorquens (strain ATCC 14718 / DSM 1338 / JCM 2805 / NCIMB 9133 / AM1) TaxID=272630 RepID=C5B6X3_METEA|nr:hypothetical protein [Methylorubrum extorquens]ACS44205.1 Hypothetical protein MexAM1_p3METAp0031 [Methylorubrum extorquens AM1]MCP1591976.1 hypothetical protein [Methylorubrum extorquens]
MPPLDRIVASVRRSTREDVRVILRERRGGVGVELRVAAAKNGRGPMVETPQGLRLPPERLPEVIAALQDAQRLAASLGLLPGPAKGTAGEE